MENTTATKTYTKEEVEVRSSLVLGLEAMKRTKTRFANGLIESDLFKGDKQKMAMALVQMELEMKGFIRAMELTHLFDNAYIEQLEEETDKWSIKMRTKAGCVF